MKLGKKDKSPFRITAKGSESTKQFANKQEKELAKDLGGRLTPNSGATPFMKGDILLDTTKMIDLKSAKTSNQIIISVGMLKKLLDDAYSQHRDPVLVLDFPKSDLLRKKWVCIPIEDYDAK